MTTSIGGAVRIGAVNYLNSKPLIEGLAELLPEAELTLDYPSRLADDLEAGRLDVALVPSIEVLRHSNYEIVSDACVATRGPVMSVKLYSRVPFGLIRTLALDAGSRTSAALVRIMLRERYGVTPRLEPFPLDQSPAAIRSDAFLMIGDRAMHEPEAPYVAVWDLGEEWLRWTGLPFVFAVWAARVGTNLLRSRKSSDAPGFGGRTGGRHCQTGGSAAWLERRHRVQLSHQEFAFSDWIGRADRLATVLASGGRAATRSRGGGACLPRLRHCLRKRWPANGCLSTKACG